MFTIEASNAFHSSRELEVLEVLSVVDTDELVDSELEELADRELEELATLEDELDDEGPAGGGSGSSRVELVDTL